ncbi:MAG: serine protease [Patescibacteria group bacterium]|nr:serine protease [Patescibacteria group bacterium]
MLKKFQQILIIVVGLLVFNEARAEANVGFVPSGSTVTNPFQSIVKIKTYTITSGGALLLEGFGSGVVISNDGKILTNHHVVTVEDYDNKKKDSIYEICFTLKSDQRPECWWGASLIASDKSLDLALLSIKKIANVKNPEISFIPLKLSSVQAQSGDSIKAIGYPAIGGKTITFTQGVISGVETEGNKRWLKTDAVTSFGSSGGAALNTNNEIIGITSAGKSDSMATIGYLIDASIINTWLENNLSKQALVNNKYDNQLSDFIKKENGLKVWNKFINYRPDFQFTRPNDWLFDFADETSLEVSREGDEDSGSCSVQIERAAFSEELTDKDYKTLGESLTYGDDALVVFKNQEVIKMGNTKFLRLDVSYFDIISINQYITQVGNSLLAFTCDSGKEEKDKNVIAGMLKSFVVGVNKISVSKELKFKDPNINIKVGSDFSLLASQNREAPFSIFKNGSRLFSMDVSLSYFENGQKQKSNKDIVKNSIDSAKKLDDGKDNKVKVIESNDNYKINAEMNNLVKIVIFSKNSKKAKGHCQVDYRKIINKNYAISFSWEEYLSEKDCKNKSKDFEKALAGISFK